MFRKVFVASWAAVLAWGAPTDAQSPTAPGSGAVPTPPAVVAPDPAQPVPAVPAVPAELATPAAGAMPDGSAPPAPADNSFLGRSTLTGDWLGLRPTLQQQGLTFEGNLTQFLFTQNGGVNRLPPGVPLPLRFGGATEYTGRGDYALTIDTEKFGGLPKGRLLIRAQNWFGRYANVSFNTGTFPPAVFPSALPPVPNDQGTPFITDFVLTQPLSPNWVVFAGKKNVIGAVDQDDFAGGNGIAQFVNQALIANPAFLLGLPYSSFTAGVVSPREWGAVSAFVYDPQDRTKNFFSVDTLFSTGVILGGEVKLKTNFFGMPGQQHVGGLYKRVELTNLAFNEPPPGVYPQPVVPGSPTLPDSYTIYYGFDQYLQVYDEKTKKGWGLFGRASISDGNPTPIRYFLSGGIGGASPIRGRENDSFGLAFYYTGLGGEFGPLPRAVFGPRDGAGVEVFYNIQLTPWMNLTPDFQILKPEAGALARTSYLGGLRLNLRF